MAQAARSGPDILFQALCNVGTQGRKGGRKTAKNAASQRQDHRKRRNGAVQGDRVNARHGLGQNVDYRADCDRRKCQP